MLKIYGKGEKVPFYKKFQGEMNAVFGCPCFVEETESEFIVDPIGEDRPVVCTDIAYHPKKTITIRYKTEATMGL